MCGPAILPSRLELDIASAHALRRANELSFHLGIQPEGEILIWLWDTVHVLPVIDLEPCEDGESARFLQSRHDPEDVQTLDHCRAFQMMIQPNSKHRHFGLISPTVWDDEKAKQRAAFLMMGVHNFDGAPSLYDQQLNRLPLSERDVDVRGNPVHCTEPNAAIPHRCIMPVINWDAKLAGEQASLPVLPPCINCCFNHKLPYGGDWIGRMKNQQRLRSCRWMMCLIFLASLVCHWEARHCLATCRRQCVGRQSCGRVRTSLERCPRHVYGGSVDRNLPLKPLHA